MIQDVGNVELFELFETDPKTSARNARDTAAEASSIAQPRRHSKNIGLPEFHTT